MAEVEPRRHIERPKFVFILCNKSMCPIPKLSGQVVVQLRKAPIIEKP